VDWGGVVRRHLQFGGLVNGVTLNLAVWLMECDGQSPTRSKWQADKSAKTGIPRGFQKVGIGLSVKNKGEIRA
jgi:hypothetical protein